MNAANDSFVDLGGRRLHVVTAGRGTPTVVLEAGSGCSSAQWTAVFDDVAGATSVIAYDRAGEGSSDAAGPWSLEGLVADLEQVLTRSGLQPPWLLVGHSFGAYIVRAFAAWHRDDVVGMVLVDGRPEHLDDQCPQVRDYLREHFPDPVVEVALDHASQVVQRLPPLGGLPLQVITRGVGDMLEEHDLPEQVREHYEATWQRLQVQASQLSSAGRLTVAHGSGHMIPTDDAPLVSRIIVDMSRRVTTD